MRTVWLHCGLSHSALLGTTRLAMEGPLSPRPILLAALTSRFVSQGSVDPRVRQIFVAAEDPGIFFEEHLWAVAKPSSNLADRDPCAEPERRARMAQVIRRSTHAVLKALTSRHCSDVRKTATATAPRHCSSRSRPWVSNICQSSSSSSWVE